MIMNLVYASHVPQITKKCFFSPKDLLDYRPKDYRPKNLINE